MMPWNPRDLEEYLDSELEQELERRKKCRANQVCPYCGRTRIEKPCKFPGEHTGPDGHHLPEEKKP